MAAERNQLESPVYAVFSICASPDVVKAANDACAEISGAEFIGEFHEYFTPDRRPQLPPTLKSAGVCVAIVDCDENSEGALVTMERLRSMALKNLNIVACATRTEAEYLLRAMRAGCNEFLHKPAEAKPLREALARFQASHLMDNSGKDAGRILTFYGAKTGVGVTTLAVHLAQNLVRKHRKRTLLIDHKHELGHVALYLGMKDSAYHFDELVRNATRLDADLLNGFVVRHPSGLEVLTSPDQPSVQHKTTASEMEQVLNFLRNQYEFILIDSSLDYKEIVPPILRCSDEVSMTITPDVAALRDLARRLEAFNLDEETARKLRIIVNRSAGSDDAVNAEQIEAVVHHPVWVTLPYAYTDILRAINAGEPLPTNHRSKFAEQINKWADRIVSAALPQAELAAPVKKRFSLFGPRREQLA